jgi:hypothetical protein
MNKLATAVPAFNCKNFICNCICMYENSALVWFTFGGLNKVGSPVWARPAEFLYV